MSPPQKNAPLPLNKGMFDALFGEGRIGFFSNQQLSALSGTCSGLNDVLFPELRKRKLLHHIVSGEQEEAEAMIKVNPKLLLAKTQAVDYSRRTIIATPFQAALGAEDERMWVMMKPYFVILESLGKIKSARDEMKQQFGEQFPKGIESTPASKLLAMYNDLATAIIEDENNGEKAIQAFRVKITENNRVKSGKHFNMQHLIAAYQAYLDNFNRLDTWGNRNTFWNKVIGFVQRQMPANYAQAHCSGIKNVIDNEDGFERTLNLYGCGRLFPLPVDGSGLGLEFAVFSRFGVYAGARGFNVDLAAAALLNYVEQKHGALVRLERKLIPANQEPCYSVSC